MARTSSHPHKWLCAAALARVLPPGALAEEGEVTHEPGFVRRCVAFWLDTLLVSLVSMVIAGTAALVIHNVFGGGRWTGEPWGLWTEYAVFVLVELVRPALHGGSTPGGAFVRMSCETRPRTGWRRTVFYLARLGVLGGAYFFWPPAWPLLALFHLFARKMPYDYL